MENWQGSCWCVCRVKRRENDHGERSWVGSKEGGRGTISTESVCRQHARVFFRCQNVQTGVKLSILEGQLENSIKFDSLLSFSLNSSASDKILICHNYISNNGNNVIWWKSYEIQCLKMWQTSIQSNTCGLVFYLAQRFLRVPIRVSTEEQIKEPFKPFRVQDETFFFQSKDVFLPSSLIFNLTHTASWITSWFFRTKMANVWMITKMQMMNLNEQHQAGVPNRRRSRPSVWRLSPSRWLSWTARITKLVLR